MRYRGIDEALYIIYMCGEENACCVLANILRYCTPGDKSFRRRRRRRQSPPPLQRVPCEVKVGPLPRLTCPDYERCSPSWCGGRCDFLLQVTCVAHEAGNRFPSFRFFSHTHTRMRTHAASYILPRLFSSHILMSRCPRSPGANSHVLRARNNIVTCLRVRVCQ